MRELNTIELHSVSGGKHFYPNGNEGFFGSLATTIEDRFIEGSGFVLGAAAPFYFFPKTSLITLLSGAVAPTPFTIAAAGCMLGAVCASGLAGQTTLSAIHAWGARQERE